MWPSPDGLDGGENNSVHGSEQWRVRQRVDISQPTDWPLLEGLPTLAETMKDAASIPAPIDVVEKRLH